MSPSTRSSKGASTPIHDQKYAHSEVHLKLNSVTIPSANLSVVSIIEVLELARNEVIVLDSEMRQLPELGESSMIGVVLPETKKINYCVGKQKVSLEQADRKELIDLGPYNGDIFSFIQTFMSRYFIDEHHDRPFCGGLMGYINYEACLETQGLLSSSCGTDICFAFIERSIIIEHSTQLVHVQSLETTESSSVGSQWLHEVTAKFDAISRQQAYGNVDATSLSESVLRSTLPMEPEYKSKIVECQKLINEGESYELRLTDQSTISLDPEVSRPNICKNL